MLDSLLKITVKDRALGAGSFQIISLENGKVVWESPVMHNLILDGFWSLLIAHMNGDDSNPLEVTSLELGSGNTPVTPADTELDTMTVDAIPPSRITPSAKATLYEFYVVDAEMPNGTYRELGLRCGSILATRALFTTPYVKAAGRDTIIRYTPSFESA